MVYFVRSGPETLVLKLKGDFRRTEEVLLEWGIYFGEDPEEAFSVAGEYCRIVIVLIKEKDDTYEKIRVYLSDCSHVRLFCLMLNAGVADHVVGSWTEPGYLMMRLIGNIDNGIKKIREDFGGELVNKCPFFRRTLPEDSTVIYFTQKPLNNRIALEDIHQKALLVTDHSTENLLSTLRMRQTEYLGDSMGTPDWNSMEIQIGDKEGRFNIHRKRIWTAVQGLQIGTILEEGWRREYTLMGKVVDVYVLKLFTPLDEETVKGFLSGLEYDEYGERVADLDLFFKGQKISWKERGKNGGLTKIQIGLNARKKMQNSLDRYSLAKMLKLDDELKMKNNN